MVYFHYNSKCYMQIYICQYTWMRCPIHQEIFFQPLPWIPHVLSKHVLNCGCQVLSATELQQWVFMWISFLRKKINNGDRETNYFSLFFFFLFLPNIIINGNDINFKFIYLNELFHLKCAVIKSLSLYENWTCIEHLMVFQVIAVTNVVLCGVPNEINDYLSLSLVWLGFLAQCNFSILKQDK